MAWFRVINVLYENFFKQSSVTCFVVNKIWVNFIKIVEGWETLRIISKNLQKNETLSLVECPPFFTLKVFSRSLLFVATSFSTFSLDLSTSWTFIPIFTVAVHSITVSTYQHLKTKHTRIFFSAVQCDRFRCDRVQTREKTDCGWSSDFGNSELSHFFKWAQLESNENTLEMSLGESQVPHKSWRNFKLAYKDLKTFIH